MKTIKATGLAGLAAVLTLYGSPASAGQITYQCLNSSNGVTSTLSVDTDHRTVNGTTAEVSASHVAWVDKAPKVDPAGDKKTAVKSDTKNDLNRASGVLTVSSAGGHTQFHRCRQKSAGN